MFAQRVFQSCSSIASRSTLARPSALNAPVSASFTALRVRYSSSDQTASPLDLVIRNVFSGEPTLAPKQVTSMDRLWKEQSENALSEAERLPPAHAYSGRSIPVRSGRVTDAIRTLDGILSRNKVRYYLRLQRRHEKRGEKLRRLESERWRKQFANEVRNKVQLVTKIRSRGA